MFERTSIGFTVCWHMLSERCSAVNTLSGLMDKERKQKALNTSATHAHARTHESNSNASVGHDKSLDGFFWSHCHFWLLLSMQHTHLSSICFPSHLYTHFILCSVTHSPHLSTITQRPINITVQQIDHCHCAIQNQCPCI